MSAMATPKFSAKKDFATLIPAWVAAVVVSTLVGSLYSGCLFLDAGGARYPDAIAMKNLSEIWVRVASSFALGSAVVGAVSIVIVAIFLLASVRDYAGKNYRFFCVSSAATGALSAMVAVALSLMLYMPEPALLFLFEVLAGAAGGFVGGGVYYAVRQRTLGT